MDSDESSSSSSSGIDCCSINTLPDGFKWEDYTLLNEDLFGMTQSECERHYLLHGQYEQRSYSLGPSFPSDFDWRQYVHLNEDLKHMDKISATRHYFWDGMREKRRYQYNFPTDLDLEEYTQIYRLEKDGTSAYEIRLHFMLHESVYYKRGLNICNFEELPFVDTDKYINTVYIVSNNHEGGSSKYIKDLCNTYTNTLFVYIRHAESMYLMYLKPRDILFVQHLMNTTVTCAEIEYVRTHFPLSKFYLTVHDFCWFHETLIDTFNADSVLFHGAYLSESICVSDDAKRIFDLMDVVIFPSCFILNEYAKYFDSKHFVFSRHIDYPIVNITKPVHLTDPDVINIGVLHEFSIYKGSELVQKLMSQFPQVRFKICGYNVEKYNEDTFDLFLRKHDIHGLLVLNKWGESYSYALTKFINSGLPILYNNFGAVKERMQSITYRENHFIALESENEFENDSKLFAKFQGFIDYIIAQDRKEHYELCYTQNKVDGDYTAANNNATDDKNDNDGATSNQWLQLVDVPSFYDTLFQIHDINVVIITSKIITTTKEYTYTSTRSIYTQEERLRQTIETIASIRRYIPNSYIVLVDNSPFANETKGLLSNITDKLLNCTDDTVLQYETDVSIYKGIGELLQIIRAYELFFRFVGSSHIRNLFKISGRYVINNQFNMSQYCGNENMFRRNYGLPHVFYYYTSFYRIAPNEMQRYFEALVSLYANKHAIEGRNMEEFVPEAIPFREIEHLGITQNISVWKDFSAI
jgi:hypothetical protein